jgi:hypothetical protein
MQRPVPPHYMQGWGEFRVDGRNMAAPPTSDAPRVPYGSLFRYATAREKAVIALGCLASAGTGQRPNSCRRRPPPPTPAAAAHPPPTHPPSGKLTPSTALLVPQEP